MGKKKKEEDEAIKAGWIVSFADMMTLMFAAFLVLWSLKPEGTSDVVEKIDIFTATIRESFSDIPDIISKDKTVFPSEKNKTVFQYIKAEQVTKPTITRFRSSDQVINIINKEMKKTKKLLDVKQTDETKQDTKDEAEQAAVSVIRDQDGFRIRLISMLFFKKGSWRISKESIKTLNDVGKVLKDLGRTVVVEGHTDNAPLVGDLSNWELSSMRAASVAQHFIQKVGIAPSKIKVAGYADQKRIADNATAEGRQMNRRIELKVEYER